MSIGTFAVGDRVARRKKRLAPASRPTASNAIAT